MTAEGKEKKKCGEQHAKYLIKHNKSFWDALNFFLFLSLSCFYFHSIGSRSSTFMNLELSE